MPVVVTDAKIYNLNEIIIILAFYLWNRGCSGPWPRTWWCKCWNWVWNEVLYLTGIEWAIWSSWLGSRKWSLIEVTEISKIIKLPVKLIEFTVLLPSPDLFLILTTVDEGLLVVQLPYLVFVANGHFLRVKFFLHFQAIAISSSLFEKKWVIIFESPKNLRCSDETASFFRNWSTSCCNFLAWDATFSEESVLLTGRWAVWLEFWPEPVEGPLFYR